MVTQCPARGHGSGKGSFVFYRYDPSLAAACIFAVLFAITSGLHIWQTWKKRSWFMIAFIIGGLLEAIGYVGRIWSTQNPCLLSPYIWQTLCLLLGPALFAASIYMILGRLILLTNAEKFALVRPSWTTKIFVGGDVLCFLMQGAGGGIMSAAGADLDKRKKGENLIVGGLFVQLAFFGFFVVVAAIFQFRGRQHLNNLPASITWRKHLYTLYFTSIFILVRSLFRIIEYLQGNDGYLLGSEVFLYIFDSLLMFAVMVSMNVVHPGDIALMLKGKGRDGEFHELQTGDNKHEAHETTTPVQGSATPWA